MYCIVSIRIVLSAVGHYLNITRTGTAPAVDSDISTDLTLGHCADTGYDWYKGSCVLCQKNSSGAVVDYRVSAGLLLGQ